jgi:hypothetical protein
LISFFGDVVFPSEFTVQVDAEIFDAWRLWDVMVIQSYWWALLTPEREGQLGRFSLVDFYFPFVDSFLY